MPELEFLSADDGLHLPAVGTWGEVKHDLFAYYAQLFATSMKHSWDCRVYLDLFSGAGKARVKRSRRVTAGSPLLALSVNDPFDHYVLCEEDPVCMDALRQRVNACCSDRQVKFFYGNSNAGIDEILALIPSFSAGHRGLTLCFADPFRAAQLEFETLACISARLYVDFLVLLPSYMDINRNEPTYVRANCPIIDVFLGRSDWRRDWADPAREVNDFGLFVADHFGRSMEKLGFLYEGPGDYELVRMTDHRNQRLYHLAFYDFMLPAWRVDSARLPHLDNATASPSITEVRRASNAPHRCLPSYTC